MLWTQAVVHTTTQGIEPVSGILLMNGINGYEVQDSEDFKSFLENKEVYFDYIEDDLLKLKSCETTVTFYLPQNKQGFEMLEAIRSGIKQLKLSDKDGLFGTLELSGDTTLEEQDWENNWKQYFKPFPVGENLCIKPSWETLPEELKNKTVIEIDPSSSFGTGSHTTTKLCLEKIEKYLKKGDNVLDMGCGSGILGIAASKLGASKITAVDIDENSARIAGENYIENHVDKSSYRVLAGNILNDKDFYDVVCNQKYDLIEANIVADVIIWLAPVFKKVLESDGRLIVSGIISQRSAEVTDALEKVGFKVIEFAESSEWAAIVLCHASL